jgi:hypothetical protein
VRHVVFWSTVAACMITHMDRVVISTAAPVIQKGLGISLVTMGGILSAFRWGYAQGLTHAGSRLGAAITPP